MYLIVGLNASHVKIIYYNTIHSFIVFDVGNDNVALKVDLTNN